MVRSIFDRLDYTQLGSIYCDEGGDAFWKARRSACEKLGLNLAAALRSRLKTGGRSLYVGAGVAELPLLIMERLELKREVAAFNLRAEEVAVLNEALAPLDIELQCADAGLADGRFDHLAMISTLNDPERFPQLSALSYGRADPSIFDPKAFVAERQIVLALADACLGKLTTPALVTTSVEEIVWITGWCARQGIPCHVGMKLHPTAIVEDPVCFIRVGGGKTR
jgi:hypothetical protein